MKLPYDNKNGLVQPGNGKCMRPFFCAKFSGIVKLFAWEKPLTYRKQMRRDPMKKHYNLYYLFHEDKQRNPMPEKRRIEIRSYLAHYQRLEKPEARKPITGCNGGKSNL